MGKIEIKMIIGTEPGLQANSTKSVVFKES